MIVSFAGTVDSISEDGFVVFVGKPGGYKLPAEPEDIALVIRKAFRAGQRLRFNTMTTTSRSLMRSWPKRLGH